MRLLILFLSFIISTNIEGQTFECDEKSYLISYTQSAGFTTLYQLTELNGKFSSISISLSESRKLTGLSYNVKDKYLYALDVDTYEVIRIDRNGFLYSLGVPNNIDKVSIINSGTMAPDGTGMLMIGYDPGFKFDDRFYTININENNLNSGYLGVTGANRVAISDFATDPFSGIMYGYDNLDGRLMQVGLGGQMAAFDYKTTGVKNMDGIWFNRDSDLFAFSAQSGIYKINKNTGELTRIGQGPGGTHGDACACPYTYSFTKEVEPRTILPCQEFEVKYSFQNRLGIGQVWITLQDTFPEGFEILDIESKILSSSNRLPSPPNVVSIHNFIYLLRENEIVVKVRAPRDFEGEFSSRATQWDFPIAFGEFQYSDDISTAELQDPTLARVVKVGDIRLSDYVQLNCTADSIIISSPIVADSYLWNTGSQEASIKAVDLGWYTLRAEDECNVYYDSVFVADFGEPANLIIEGESKIQLGQSVLLSAKLTNGSSKEYVWSFNNQKVQCNCPKLSDTPSQSTDYSLEIVTEKGCRLNAQISVEVELLRNLFAPTAFSPNGDGLNDFFFLSSSVKGVIRNLIIYDRWGGLVFQIGDIELNNELSGWHGKNNNKNYPIGLYIWSAEIEYFDGVKDHRTGTVSLF